MELTDLLTNLPGLGIGVVFLWLYLQERRAHDETQREYRKDLRDKLISQRNQREHP